jgi:SAM-dependent methyltransferase
LKPLYTVSSGYLVAQYAAIGVDVNRLLSAVTEFTLYEDDYGLRRWLPIVAGDEEFYINLVENIPGYYAKEKKEYEYAARWLCGEDPTLEVGCGEGLFAQLYKIMNYTGLELNGSAVKQGKRAGINILQDDFICFADRFPSSVSRLFSFHLLEHFADPYEYLASAHKVLHSNGLMITAVPAEDSFRGVLRHDILNCPPHHVTRWADRSLRAVPAKFGLDLVDLYHIPVEPMHKDLFLDCFLQKAVFDCRSVKGRQNNSKRYRIASYIMAKMMKTLVKEAIVPEEFNIPGYTVMCVHRKV